MISSIDTNLIPIVLASISLLAVILLIFIYWRPIRRVAKEVRRQEQSDDPEMTPESGIPVSVIVYANDSHRDLETLIGSIFEQSYANPFEVIVINEGGSDMISTIVDQFRVRHPNIYQTFIPESARNVSRKKLGLMLGMKAARYPAVMLTTGNSVINSPLWLARMMEPFAADPLTDVVIGNAINMPEQDEAAGSRARAFGEAADAITWLTAAIGRHPYRGIENNLAYRRETFFDNRGFSHSLNLVNGDDDIFISEIARPDNTAVVLHPDAFITRVSTDPRRNRRETRTRYTFTGRFISKAMRRKLAAGAWLLWIQFITAISALVLVANNLITGIQAKIAGIAGAGIPVIDAIVAGSSLLLLIATIITTMVIWRKSISAIGGRSLRWSVLPFALGRPFGNIRNEISASRRRDRFHSWPH